MARAQRLLVTGAGGFLGVHLVEAAQRAGLDVIAHVHRAGDAANLLESVPCPPADLAGALDLAAWLDSLAPAIVIHAAALSRLADCERDPDLARRVNAEAPRELARACARRGARLVHVSTDLVFGRHPAPPDGFREDAEPQPLSEYGRTKLLAERAVAAANPGALMVRLPLLFGPSQDRGLGASDSLLAAVARGERPALFEDEWRTPLDVRSASEALIELARGDLAGILHVAGAERMSRHELGLRVLRRSGLSAEAARAAIQRTTRGELGLEASRPADVSLDASRARGLLTTILFGPESGSR